MTKSPRLAGQDPKPHNELQELYAEKPQAEAGAAEALVALASKRADPACLSQFLYAQSKLRAIDQRIKELEIPKAS